MNVDNDTDRERIITAMNADNEKKIYVTFVPIIFKNINSVLERPK